MSNKQVLKGMINERLSTAAEEIFALFEQALVEYQREIDRLKNVDEAREIHVVLLPEKAIQTENMCKEELTDPVDNEGPFYCKEETDPPGDEPQIMIVNIKSLKDEERPHGQQQKTNSEVPERLASEGAETNSEHEQNDGDTDNDEEPFGSDPPNKAFSCPACSRHFPQIKGLKMHMRMVHPDEKALYLAVCKAHHRLKPGMEIVSKTLDSLEAHKRKHSDVKTHSSRERGALFPKKSTFTTHMSKAHSSMDKNEEPFRSNAPNKAFSCPACSRHFPQIKGLKMHMRMVHPDEKALYLAVCKAHHRLKPGMEIVSKTLDSLEAHKRKHSDVKTHSSRERGPSFPKKSTFITHMSDKNEEPFRSNAPNKAFSCPTCEKCFPRIRGLKLHMRKVHEEPFRSNAPNKAFSCPTCEKCFPRIRGLKLHMRKVHPSEKALYLSLCKDRLDSQQRLKPHVVRHRRFKFQSSRMAHKGEHTEGNPYSCQECGESFPKKSTFITHMSEAHSSMDKDEEPFRSNAPNKAFSCPACSRHFPQIKGLKMHMRMVHPDEKALYLAVCKAHHRLKPGMEIVSKTLDSLEAHKRKHSDVKTHSSRERGASFPKKSTFITHMSDKNEEPFRSNAPNKAFSCPTCEKCFPRIRGLKLHMRKVHPSEKALYLSLCKDRLDSQQRLKPHVVRHRRFKFQSSRMAHKGEHTEGNPYSCQECGESFPKQSHFIKHMRQVHSIDKPFKCSVCNKSWHYPSALNTHTLIHTGEKPFVCSVCGKGCTTSANLKFHMITHLSKKQFGCKKYKSRQTLNQHVCAVVDPNWSLEGAALNKENSRSSGDAQEDKPQILIMNEESLNGGEELQLCGQEQQTRNGEGPEEQASGGAVSDISSNSECEKEDSDTGRKEEPNKAFGCPVCEKRFPQIKGLKVHMKKAHPSEKALYSAVCKAQLDDECTKSKPKTDRLFKCRVCDKQFQQLISLKLHLSKHSGQDRFRCVKCSVPFTMQSDFVRHMKTVHSVDKPFECSVCEKGFMSNTNLKNHMDTHTGTKRFHCTICDKKFAAKHGLLKHGRRYHH